MSDRAASRGLAQVLLPLTMLVVVAAGCATSKAPPPPPLQPPSNVNATVAHRAGSPTELPTTRPAPAVNVNVRNALTASVEWVALTQVPDGLPPVGSQARLIAAPRAADPLLAAAGQLSRGARIVPADKLDDFLDAVRERKHGESVAIAENTAALPTDVTASFNLADASERRLGIDIHRPATTQPTAAEPAVQLSLLIEDAGTKRERLLLDPMPSPMRLGLVLPSQFPSDRVKAVLAVVNVGPPSDSPGHADAVARCQSELRQVADAAATPAESLGGDWASMSAALASFAATAQAQPPQPARLRAAMVYLAAEAKSELLGDVALVATPETLAALHHRIAARVGDPPKGMDRDVVGWQLDAATLEELASQQSAEKLPAELAGVLARFAGEAARNAGSLDELIKLPNRNQFQARLIAENFTYLEDASPSSRVRAYDWLAARGRAPAKYDPLAASRERAAAIDAAMTAAATQAAGGAQ